MPVTGQLWYSTEGNLADARVGYVNSDSNTTTVVVDNSPTTDLVTAFTEDVVFDTAAGLYYVLVSGNQGVNARLLVGHIGSSAPPTVAFTFDPTFAGSENNLHFGLHLDPINERIYVGSIDLVTFQASTQGVRQFSYNPATGSVTDNGLIYTQAVAAIGASAPGATALFIPRDFDIDSTHNVMYASTYALGDGFETNALVRINLANLSAPSVSLVDPALFPLDDPAGPPVGSDDFNTLNGIIQDVEVDVDSDRVYFSTHAEEVDEGGAGGDPEDAIWMVANASTAVNATPTKLALSAGTFAASFVTTNFYPGDMVLDEVNNILYVESENSNSGSTNNADVILKFQLNGAGTGATLIDVINAGFTGTANIEGMTFNQLAKIANVNGTTTHSIQQGSAITLLTVDPTISDFDGDHLAGATVAISGSSAGSGDNLTAIGGQTSGVIAGTNITVTRTTDGSGNQTLTFTGYDTLANYQTVLGDVRFDSTNGGGTTRTITWQVNDGAAGNPSGTVNGTDTNVRTTSITIDPPTSISVNDVTLAEGNAGTTSFTFTVGLSAASASTVTVDYATANNTAVAGSDYATLSGPLTFLPGELTKTVTVLVNGDTLNEANETFFLNLSNASNATILDSQGVGTITNDDPVPSLSVNDPSVTEGNAGTTTLTFTVTLNAASGQTVTVNYATADGTAVAGTDYTAASGVLTFAPGVTSQTINVTVTGDTVFEPNQTLFLNLSAATNATITDNQGVGTITNDDTAPTLTIGDVTVSEAAGTATFTVTRTGATEVPITVDYATADGTAVSTAGGPGTPDYTGTSGTLTFAPSLSATATQTFTVAIGNDGIYEAAEQLLANLSNPVGATIADGQGVLTITDDDAAPTIAVNDVTVGENGTATFTVTLTGATALPISVNYATVDGTAVSSASATPGTPDYLATSGTLTFNPSASGTQTLTVTVPLVDDATNEPTEQFALNLSGPTNGATLADAQGIATVTDGDPVPTISVDDVIIAEGDAGTTAMTFTVSLSAASGQTVTVNYATADGTALAGSDYAAASGTLTFAPGVTTQTVTVLVTGETVFEVDQTLLLNLNGPTNATIADGQGVGTITNDDAAPTLSIGDVSVSEAAGTATYTVTRTGATETGITVDYATADGTAVSTAGGPGTPDYTATSGTLTFAPSLAATATQTFTVAIDNDAVYEGVEQAVADLSNATGATIADGQGVLTITNDDAAPTLSVGDITVSEDGTATFTVTLTGATALPISVDYATADGTAVSAASATPGTPDYVATSGTLTFAASAGGTQTLTVTVPLNDDATNEPTEQFAINLSNPTNGATITDSQGVGTVTDNDPVPSLSIDDVTVAEGNAGTTAFTFTVTLSAASAQTTTVDFATVDGTALAGSDYTAASGTLTFAPGVTTQTITVLVNGDTALEPDEAFTVALSNPTNATIFDNSGTGTIDNDDNDPPTADNVGPVAGTEDQPARIAITLSGNDTDVGDAVTQFVLQSLPAGGGVFATDTGGTALTAGATIPATGTGPYTATVWFQPDPDFNGTDSFTYQADDGTDLSTPATVSLDIAALNDAPSFDIAGNQNVNEDDGAITVAGFASNFQPGPATATDEAGQTLVDYTVTTDNPSLFAVGPAIDAVTGDLTYTLADDANGVANVTVVATDSGPSGGANVNQATRNFAINVAAVADAPVVAAPIADQFGNVDIAFAFSLPAGTFTDADGDTLTLTATLADGSSLPAGLTFDPSTGTFSGEFATEQAFDIRVTASDGTSTVSDDFRLSIRAMPEPTDRPPLLIASSRAATVPENTTATGILLTPSDDNPGTFFEVGDFTLAGADAQRFAIVQTAAGFELVFKDAPDFENPADAGGNNVYDVSVWVRNAGQNSAAVSLGVTVSDVAEGSDGTPGDDDLNGTPGDDVFSPLGGDDDVSGGAGNDTVVLPGVAAGYVFVQLISGNIGVIDIDPSDGDQGSDVLDSIEFVRFADGINVDAESLISREQASWMLDTSDVEIVAATWQLLMGLVPTEAGFQYLINSPENPTDLNDSYFMSFNMENKYQSFLSNLATETAGSKEWFDREFGGLTYQQAVEKAFDTIITAAALVEAGGDPAASKAFFLNAESYFNAVASERIVRPGVDLAEGTKIALLSSVLYEAVKAGIGPYAEQVDEFATDLARVGYSAEFHSNLFETA